MVLPGVKRVVYMDGLLRAWATRCVVGRRGLPPVVVPKAQLLPPAAPRPAKAWERLSMCCSCGVCCCCCGCCWGGDGVWGWPWKCGWSLPPSSSLAPRKSRGAGRLDEGAGGEGEVGRTLLLSVPITTGSSSKDRSREPWPSAGAGAGGGGGVGEGADEGDGTVLTGLLALVPKLRLTMLGACALCVVVKEWRRQTWCHVLEW